jgi:hypothetical protein
MSLPEITFTLIEDSDIEAERLARDTNLFTPGVDFALDSDGDLEWPIRFTTGLEAVAQSIRIGLLMIKGELPHNLDFGIPWLPNDHVPESEAILGGKYNETRLREIFRSMIASRPGVIQIRSLLLDFDRPERTLALSFNVMAEDGTILGELEV